MSNRITRDKSLEKAASSEIEAQVRKDAAGLSPSQIEEIVALVLKFGPTFYKVILRLFHITPKKD